MKKLITTLFITGFFISSCNQKLQKNEINKEEYVNMCIAEGQKMLPIGVFDDNRYKAYCVCCAEKAFEEFTIEELIQLKTSTDSLPSDLDIRFFNLIQSCNEKLKK